MSQTGSHSGPSENRDEQYQGKGILEKEIQKLKIECTRLEKANNELSQENSQLKKSIEEEKKKITTIFNDDTIVKLYHSKDWKLVLKLYSFKKKYFSNDSEISKKINSFVDLFKPKKSHSLKSSQLKPRILNLQQNLDYTKILIVPVTDEPVVSIVIPVYNGWRMNYRCVKSIIENTRDITYEIILADDCSVDETKECTQKIKNVVHLYNKVNLGFLKNCNNAAKSARGEFILFLNSDTEVQPDWLSPLVDIMRSDEQIGMTGSKLIYPNGILQEAGGIIWNDATGWNYGKNQHPDSPEYNYVKEVDYISGASIMIRRPLWEEIGGFDELYTPAYCEDSDLAFSVRNRGYKVVYQPLSEVVHLESVSHGKEKEPVEGKLSIDAVRILNQKKFFEKWKDILSTEHFPNGDNVFYARDRSWAKKTILVIDHYVPEYDKDAGSKTVLHFLEVLIALGMNVKFLGDNFFKSEPYITILEQMGVEVLYGHWYRDNWQEWILTNKEKLDFVLLNRPHISLKYLIFFKQNTNAKILFYGHDLHFLRESRRYEIDNDQSTLESSEQWKSKELYIFENVDHILVPSADEKAVVLEQNPAFKVSTILPYCFKLPALPIANFSERTTILFIGGFGHPPNVDGVVWFCKHVWPLVTTRLKGVNFTIVGSKVTTAVKELQSDNVSVLGFVTEQELEQVYSRTRIAVVPLRYGAGVKGKTVEAMYHGIPIVSTAIGLEGLQEVEAILKPVDQAEAFAEELVSLYTKEDQLIDISHKETEYINRHFSWVEAMETFKSILNPSNQ